MAEQRDRPDYVSKSTKAMLEDLQVVRDVAKGGRWVRDQGVRYLPRHTKEELADYEVRRNLSVLFNGVQRTVDGLAGMVFREDPVLVDVPPQVAAHLETVDNAGTHFDVFAKNVFADAIEAGHAGVLVDVPRMPQSGRRPTIAEEAAIGLRPYWVHYLKEDILSWRPAVVNGRTVLTQLVLRERVVEEDGDFGEKEATYYRVLRRTDAGVTVQRLAISDETDGVVVVDEEAVVTNQTDIPFVPIYGKRTGMLMSQPPLLDLAETNLAHYRLLSDHLYKLHLCNLPVGVLTGVDPDTEIGIGPNAWLKLPADAGFAWSSPDGTTFKDNLEQLHEFKADMAAQGLSLLQVETRQAETFEAKRMDKAESDSSLATAARSLQDGLEQLLVYHGNFMQIQSPGTVEISRDFENQPMTPEEMREWRENVGAGTHSLDTMWAVQRARGSLPDDFDPEIERERIAAGSL